MTDIRQQISTFWWPILLPFAYLCHLSEEWWGGDGFSVWTQTVLGLEVSPERFLLINGIALPIFLLGTLAGMLWIKMRWFLVSFSTLVLLNGTLHLLATVLTGVYSPGLISGVVFYLPLGSYILLHLIDIIPRNVFVFSVAAGLLVHGLIAIAAFS